jgi:hypothetical protein
MSGERRISRVFGRLLLKRFVTFITTVNKHQ